MLHERVSDYTTLLLTTIWITDQERVFHYIKRILSQEIICNFFIAYVIKVEKMVIILLKYIWPINKTLSGATTPNQSGPGSDGNKGALRIPQSSSITETSSSDCLVSYLGQLSAEKQSVYSTAPADWVSQKYSTQFKTPHPTQRVSYAGHSLGGRGLTPLQRFSRCILQPQPT